MIQKSTAVVRNWIIMTMCGVCSQTLACGSRCGATTSGGWARTTSASATRCSSSTLGWRRRSCRICWWAACCRATRGSPVASNPPRVLATLPTAGDPSSLSASSSTSSTLRTGTAAPNNNYRCAAQKITINFTRVIKNDNGSGEKLKWE